MERITTTPTAAGIQPIASKCCNVCKMEKPLTEFYRNHNKKDGHSYTCKECHRAYMKEYKAKNKAKINPPNQLRHHIPSFQRCSRVKSKLKSASV